MGGGLGAGDQEQYFRVLARADLLLPTSADSAGRRSPGWGTWSSDGRTHVLAFTSPQAMRVCLAEHAGSYRVVAFRDLAEQWPNAEWWLAVNPGLPIEGYLPSWFVSQISRGDVRLPGRTMGSRARMEHASTLRARAVAQVPRREGDESAETGPAPSRDRADLPSRDRVERLASRLGAINTTRSSTAPQPDTEQPAAADPGAVAGQSGAGQAGAGSGRNGAAASERPGQADAPVSPGAPSGTGVRTGSGLPQRPGSLADLATAGRPGARVEGGRSPADSVAASASPGGSNSTGPTGNGSGLPVRPTAARAGVA